MNELNTLIFTATPLVFAVVGETITEKAGVINLSMEGSLMLSAMAGFVIAFETNSLLLGFLAAAVVGLLVALLIAFSSIRLKLNQVAVGFVLFQLCTDLSTFLGNGHVRIPGPTVQAWPIPLLKDIPVLDPIFFRQNLLVYFSYLLVLGTWWFMFRTRPGLGLPGSRPCPRYLRQSIALPLHRSRWSTHWNRRRLLLFVGQDRLVVSTHAQSRLDRSRHRHLRRVATDPSRRRGVPVRRTADGCPIAAGTAPGSRPGSAHHPFPVDDPHTGHHLQRLATETHRPVPDAAISLRRRAPDCDRNGV